MTKSSRSSNSSGDIQIVILAGGLGTRLRPITEQIPKAMIPIHGKPFIHYQLQSLAHWGIRDIILSTGYLGNQIQDYVQDGKAWGVKVRYTSEGKNLRGTAGAIRLIYDEGMLQERFLVTYGDSYLPINFKSVWNCFIESPEPALMTVLRNQGKWDKSNACFDGSKVTLYDKRLKEEQKPATMQFIDYGLSGLSRHLIAENVRSDAPSDLAELFHDLSKKGKLLGYEVKERFYEIGSLSGIQDLENYISENNH